MTRVQRRAAAICVAAVAVLGAFVASSATGKDNSCLLAARMTFIKGSQGAGNVSYKLTVSNSGTACRLNNQPILRLVGKSGKNLPTKVIWSGKAGSVLIKKGGRATANMRFSPDIPGPGDHQHGACQPKAYKIKLVSAGVLLGPVSPPTSVCERGTMRVTSLR
jgi:hypothetical protein